LTQFTFKSGIVADFKSSKLKDINSVPVGNSSAYKELVGEAETKEFINVVALGEDNPAHPDPYTTIVLTEEWAKSFVKSVKDSPKPLFIEGHTDAAIGYKMRAVPDGYLTGGMVLGETLYLRNTLVLEGTEDKKALINQTVKEINAGMLSTSTSDYLKYETKTDEEGNVTYFAVESVKGQSNAIVEADMTGSDASIIITSFKAGIDSSGENKKGEEQMGEKTMTNTELFTSLRNQLDSGRLALSTVAESLGIELMTAKDKVALKRLTDVEARVGSIDEFVASVEAEKEGAFTSLKEAKLKEKFNTPELLEIAEPMFSLKEGSAEDIGKEVERIAELKAFKAIQSKLALSMNYNPGTGEEATAPVANETMEG
ncbi:MAG: hypothetical protein DRP09_13830, partial [Candidatus Thorarchaeota archaeon]